MSETFGEKMITSVLALLLWTLPLLALPNPEVIGTVMGSKAASVGGIGLRNGGTILNNDELVTGHGGKALVQFSPTGRMALSENTVVRFSRRERADVAEMASGALVAETRSAGTIVVQTRKYEVEPVNGNNTIYLVAMVVNGSTVVAARDGSVAITDIGSGKSYVLKAGLYAEIPASASGVPGSNHPGKNPAKTPRHIGHLSHAASEGLVVAIAAGTAAAIAIPLAVSGPSVSPSTP